MSQHTPTNDELNRAMAVALGWTEHKSYWFRETPQGTLQTGVVPSYCTDRNLLPDVWDSVSEGDKPPVGIGGRWSPFCAHLMELVLHRKLLQSERSFNFGGCDLLRMIAAEPRLHVMAALKVLDQWPADWQAEP